MQHFQPAKFLTSAAGSDGFPEDSGTEVAFAGRSNAGKSTVINTVCGQPGLARTAKIPGRTQTINFFETSRGRLVDLPGYGYAHVPRKVRGQWDRLTSAYFARRRSLRGVVVVVDIRRLLAESDWRMIEWCNFCDLYIVLTKADKLSRSAEQKALQQTRAALAGCEIDVQVFSSKTPRGVEALRSQISFWMLHRSTQFAPTAEPPQQ